MKINNTFYKFDKKLDKRIVLISDIHYKSKKDSKILNKVLDNIKKLKPNYICIPGDLTDTNSVEEESLIEWLTKLSSISKVIISIGNHEFYDAKRKQNKLNIKLLNKIKKINNIYLLNDENVIIDNIHFYGITYRKEYYLGKTEMLNYFKNIKTNSNEYNVLLIHSPINISNEEINNKFNLILCGHMHGGVVLKSLRPIFKNNGLISPTKKLFPKNVYGKLGNVIISSGIIVTPYKFINYFFHPEVVLIHI